VRLPGSYKFVHDRVQEAAYSLVSEQSRAEAHLRIGRLLAAHTPPEQREEAIFEVVNQINRGAILITSRDEREEVAELNLIAGKRAKASTAYASALNYLVAGAALLADDCWERRHGLMFELEFHRSECEFLTGDLAAADERLTILSSRAANVVELTTVTCLRVDLYTTLDQTGCRLSRLPPTSGRRMVAASDRRRRAQRIQADLVADRKSGYRGSQERALDD
jgi:predicted ATPase